MSLAGRPPARFVLVGASNTLISYGVFVAALRWLPEIAGRAATAQAVSYGAGILWSFYWNRRWTFGATGPVARTLVGFTAIQLLLLVTSTGLVGLLVDALAWPAMPSWIAVMAPVAALNYLVQRHLVFATR